MSISIKSSAPLSGSEQEAITDMARAAALLHQQRQAGLQHGSDEMGSALIGTLAEHNIKHSHPDVYTVMIMAAAMLILDSGQATITPIPATAATTH